MTAKSSIPPPAGVPTGNGKYVAVVALLVIIVGGLIGWKLIHKPDAADNVVPPKPSSSVMVLNNIEDDIPPPAAPDAGIDAGTRTIVTYITNGCEAKKCAGTTSSDLEAALAQRARQSQRCYDAAVTQDSTLQGRMSIAVRVGTNGAACSANIASNELSNASLANCVVQKFRSSGFPFPRGGCVDVVVPISFVPPK